MSKTKSGFTLVELLIVIVVIAILAAITIVAYNGIQDKAHNTAIKSDLSALAKTVRLYQAENGELPVGGSGPAGNSTKFPGITFSPSKSSYDTDHTNLYYCQGKKSGDDTFIIAALSASSEVFSYTPEDGIQQVTVGNAPNACYAGWDGGVYTFSYGYNPNPVYGWFTWANG